MKFYVAIITFLITISWNCSQAQNFEFNSNCEKAYKNIIALKLDSGFLMLNQEQSQNPTNYLPILLFNYIDFLEVYTSGSMAQYEAKKQGFDKNLNQLKLGDPGSPYFLYSQAEIHMHSAVLHIKFGEYLACVFDVKKALKKLEENSAAFPNFSPNNKSLGMLYTILGSIPQQYQGGLEFIGLKGDVNYGLTLLQKAVIDNNQPFQHEAATIYAFMLLHIQNNAEKAWSVLKTNNFKPKSNLMDAFAFGHIGIYGVHNEEGLNALLQKPIAAHYKKFPLTDFLIGIGKTHKQDADANVYFKKFLDNNKGDDYIKSAWHKMAWNELILGNNNMYSAYLKNVKNSGRAVVDTDKQAENEAASNLVPNAILLKARLLTDGNYLTQALEILSKTNVNSFKSRYDKTEYFYRLARIYDKSKLFSKAIQYYEITISNGSNVPYYYAANSAYLLGYLYESTGNKAAALSNYNLCLKLDGHEYNNSIHQKAEAALNRLKN